MSWLGMECVALLICSLIEDMEKKGDIYEESMGSRESMGSGNLWGIYGVRFDFLLFSWESKKEQHLTRDKFPRI